MPLSPEFLQQLNQSQREVSGQHSALAGVLQSQQHQQIQNNNALVFGPLNPCTTGLVFDLSNPNPSQTQPIDPSVTPFGGNIVPSNTISQPIDHFSQPPTTSNHSASTLEHTQPAQELPPPAAAPLPLGRRFSNVSSYTEGSVEDTESHQSNEQLPKTLFEVKQEIEDVHTIQPAIICRAVVSNVPVVHLLTPKEERPNIQRIISKRVDTISVSTENVSNVPISANTATFTIKSELPLDDNESLEENSGDCGCGNCGNSDPLEVEMPPQEIDLVLNNLNGKQVEQREVEPVVELSPIEPNSNCIQDFFVESEMNQSESVSATEKSLKRPNEEVVENTEGDGEIVETTTGDAKRPRIERGLIAIDSSCILPTNILQTISENSAFERVIPSSPKVHLPPRGKVEGNLQLIESEGNIGSLRDQSTTSETTASNCIPTSTLTLPDTPHSPLIQSKSVNNLIPTNSQTPKSSSAGKLKSIIGESDKSQAASESQSESPKKTVITTDITTTITPVTVLNKVLDSPVIQAKPVVELVSVPVPNTVQEPTNLPKPKLGTVKKPSTDSTVPSPETKKTRPRSSVSESANGDSSKVKSVSQLKGKPNCESLPKKKLPLEEGNVAPSAAITSPLPRAQPTNTLHHASESSKLATAAGQSLIDSQTKKAPKRVAFDTNCDERPGKTKTTRQTTVRVQTRESKLKPTSTPKAASKGKTLEKEALATSSSKSPKSKPALNQSLSQAIEVTSKSSTRKVSKSPTRTDKVLPSSKCTGDECCGSRAPTKIRHSISADGESDTWQTHGEFRILKMKCHQKECDHFFTSKSRHERHMLDAHNRLPIICPLSGCQASFKTKESWINHVAVQHKDTQRWICRYCGWNFTNDRTLYGHAYMCHEEGEFECALCAFKEKYRTAVINHHTLRHKASRVPVLELHCTLEECPFTAGHQTEINRHLQSEHAIGKYSCLISDCHYNSYSYSDLQKHLDSDHQVPYVCGSGKCEEKFRQYIELENHHFEEHQKGSFGCFTQGCPFEGPTRATVNRHVAAEHMGNRNVNFSKGKPKKFTIIKVHCDSCGDLFSTEQDLEEHNLEEHKIQRYACVAHNCEKSFKEIEDIDRHVKEDHWRIQSWKCFHCCPSRPTFNLKSKTTYNELRLHRFFSHNGGDFRCNAAECTFKGSTREVVIHHYNNKHLNANQTPTTPMTAPETHIATNAASNPNGDIDYRHYDRLPNQYTQQTEDITEYTPERPPSMPSPRLPLPLPLSAFIPDRTDILQAPPFNRDPAPPHNGNFYQNPYSHRY